MKDDSRNLEWKVGIFMLLGLGVIAVMAIQFGKLGQGLKKYYIVNAEFPNASGLLKGADVYLAGARVGFTAEAPQLIEGRYAVRVALKLRDIVKIPRGSTFVISSSGFLGDAYVSINPPANATQDDPITDGEYVVGTRLEGLGDLTTKGGDIMDELKKRLQELEAPIRDVRERLLSDKNLKNIDSTFASMSEISESLKTTAKGLDQVVEKAKAAADTVKETVAAAKAPIAKLDGVVDKIDAAAGDLKGTLTDVRKAAASGGKALESARSVLNDVNAGKGTIGMLLKDKEAAENLRSLIRNLKERGVIFYRDKTK